MVFKDPYGNSHWIQIKWKIPFPLISCREAAPPKAGVERGTHPDVIQDFLIVVWCESATFSSNCCFYRNKFSSNCWNVKPSIVSFVPSRCQVSPPKTLAFFSHLLCYSRYWSWEGPWALCWVMQESVNHVGFLREPVLSIPRRAYEFRQKPI